MVVGYVYRGDWLFWLGIWDCMLNCIFCVMGGWGIGWLSCWWWWVGLVVVVRVGMVWIWFCVVD